MASMLSYVDEMRLFVEKFHEKGACRKEVGLFLRRMGARPLGAYWVHVVVLSAAMEVKEHVHGSPDEAEGRGEPAVEDGVVHDRKVKEILEKYMLMMQYITQERLEESHVMKPLLDGRQIASVLGIKPGPQVGEWMERVVEFQLMHPEASVEECCVWLKESLVKRAKME